MDREASAHAAQGHLLFQLKRYEQAANEFRAATRADSIDPVSPAMLALSLHNSGHSRQANAAAQEAIRRDPRLSLAHVARAYALWGLERHTEAVLAGQEALRCDPNDAEAHQLLARLAEGRDDFRTVVRHAGAALSRDPLDVRAATVRGRSLVSLGKIDDAIVAMYTLLRQIPDDSEIHETLGWSLLHKGNEAEALIHLREALRLDPNSERARVYFAEAMKSRNRFYRACLGSALWFGRRRRLKETLLVAIFTIYAVAMAVAAGMQWYGVLIGMAALFGVAIALLIWHRLSAAVFDLVLEFDSRSRHLLAPRERFGAWTVGGFFAAAAVAVAASLWHPAFLVFAIPTATVAPWLLYGVIIERPSPERRVRASCVIPAVVFGELGFLLAAVIEPFHLSGDILGLIAGSLIMVSFGWFVVGGWALTLMQWSKTD